MFNPVSSFFNLKNFSPESKEFIIRSTTINIIFNFLIMSVNTFFVLYALTLVSYREVGIIIAFQFVISAIVNIPTGALSDKIGERWVFFFSAIIFSLSSITLALAKNFVELIISFSLVSVADASKSGGFISWFSNNYKYRVKEDSTYQLFSEIMGKYGMLNMIGISLSFSIGALMVSIITLQDAFYFQAFLIGIFSFFLLKHYVNHPKLELTRKSKGTLTNLVEGFKFTLTDKTLRIFLIGIIITGGALNFWFKFLSFAMYDLFGKTDTWIGNLRMGEFLLGALLTGIAGFITGKILNVKKWLSISYLMAYSVLFWGFFLLLLFYGIPEYFSTTAIGLYLLTYALCTFPFYFQSVLQYRFFIDLIPDQNRNSISSIIPTLNMIFGAIFSIIGGIMLENYAIQYVFLFLGFVGLLGGIIVVIALFNYKGTPKGLTKGKFIFYSPFLGNHIVNVKTIINYSKISETTESREFIQQISEILTEEAMKDQLITEDEQNLLKTITTDVQAYIVFIDSLKVSSTFSKEDIIQAVKDYKNKIYTNGYEMAKKTDGISEDEMNILLKLTEILHSWTIFDENIILKKYYNKYAIFTKY